MRSSLTLFLGSAYADGFPMLQYSAPVLKAANDAVKVCQCGVVSLISSQDTDTDL
jgi:hypothetical protein